MTTPLENIAVTEPAREHLERLMGVWGLLSDLSFSDLLLCAPLAGGGARHGKEEADSSPFSVLGQMRPTTSQTLFPLDLVGHIFTATDLPLLEASYRRGTIVAGERPDEELAATVRYQCVPIRFADVVVGVLMRVWSPTVGRRTGGLERVYVQLYERLARMVNAGLFPFSDDDEASEDAPRVGDGVMVLDDNQRVTFASPNALNALHRMGIVAAVVGARLGDFGIDVESVANAFSRGQPTIEEIERRPDVIVLMRLIPLTEDGVVTGAAVLLRDVTDLRRRDRLLLSKDAAIREVHHRVKNNLQTISSLLRLQSRRLEDRAARDALLEAERRVSAIALVHEILAREPGEQVPFDEIVPALVRLAHDVDVSSASIAITVKGDAGDLTADVATPLAVVIAELLQNAVEHAFSSGGPDHPLVTLALANDGSMLRVEVRDNGSGFSSDFDIEKTKSLGLAIVRDLVRSQLGGAISITSDHGAVVRLSVALA